MSAPTLSGQQQSPHFMQTFLDNQWAQVILCQVVPMIIYVLWGLLDVMNIPPAP